MWLCTLGLGGEKKSHNREMASSRFQTSTHQDVERKAVVALILSQAFLWNILYF